MESKTKIIAGTGATGVLALAFILMSGSPNLNVNYICDYEYNVTIEDIYSSCDVYVNESICSDNPVNKSCTFKIVKAYEEACINQTITNQSICKKKTGFKLADGKIIDYKENRIGGCNECGTDLICWYEGDGWSEDRTESAKCTCLSGERCVIYNADFTETFDNINVKESEPNE